MLTSKAHVVFFNKIISYDTLSTPKKFSAEKTEPILKVQTQVVSTLDNHGLKRKFEEYEATAEEIKEIEKMLESKTKKPKIMKIVKTVLKPIKSQNYVHVKKSEDSNQFQCNPELKEKYDKMLSNESILQIFKYVDDLCKTIVDLDQYSARAKHIIDTIKKAIDCYDNILLDRQKYENRIVDGKPDELYENIKISDPDTKRTEEVNWKLNKSVDCYKIKLDSEKQISVISENVETESVESENVKFDNIEVGTQVRRNNP